MSETELLAGDTLNANGGEPDKKPATPTPKDQSEPVPVEQPGHQGETQSQAGQVGEEPAENNEDDDSQSNKSLDLNFASKLMDFKFSEGDQSQQQQEQQQQPTAGGSVAPTSATAHESKHTCRTCKKSFRYATTLARHERAHLPEGSVEVVRKVTRRSAEAIRAQGPPAEEEPEEQEEEEREEKRGAAESEGNASGADSGSEEEKEKEEKSDEEGGAAEPKNSDGELGGGAGSKADKRKKICNVCSKRFWSLQDLTRHMRSHTGMHQYPQHRSIVQ